VCLHVVLEVGIRRLIRRLVLLLLVVRRFEILTAEVAAALGFVGSLLALLDGVVAHALEPIVSEDLFIFYELFAVVVPQSREIVREEVHLEVDGEVSEELEELLDHLANDEVDEGEQDDDQQDFVAAREVAPLEI